MNKALRIKGKLGHGTYSKVYQVSDPYGNGTEDLVLKRNFCERNVDWCSNLKELDILARMKGHPFIIALENVSFDNPFRPEQPLTPRKKNESKDDQIHFFLERMLVNGKSLFSETERDEGYFVQVNILSCQLLLAMEYIHSHGIIHRDIKPDNILLNQQDDQALRDGECGVYLRLSDFGMSKNVCQSCPSTPGVVTSWYRAPEICMCLDYTTASDMWSVGCVFFEMIKGKPLFVESQDNSQRMYKLILDVVPQPIEENTLVDMWSRSSTSRYSQTDIRQPVRVSLLDRSEITQQEKEWFDDLGVDHTNEFFKIINGLLMFDDKKRLTATEALNMPFFESMREYIASVRQQCPISTSIDHHLVIVDCPEREWIASVANGICQQAKKIHNPEHWFKYRIIFHAVRLFDVYLDWAGDNVKKNSCQTTSVGMFHTSKQTVLNFYTVLYMSYKYFSSIDTPIYSWSVFVTEEYRTAEMSEKARRFERQMLEEVLKYKIYEASPYEYLSQNMVIGDGDKSMLMTKYLSVKAWKGNLGDLCDALIA